MRLVRALLTTAAPTAVLLAGCSSRPTSPITIAASPAGQVRQPGSRGTRRPGDHIDPAYLARPDPAQEARQLP